MLGHSAISESALSDIGSLAKIYTNTHVFVLYIRTQEELDFKVRKIEQFHGKIKKIEWL